MPRLVADYADRFADFNLFISIASFGLGASTIGFFYNMVWSWAHGPAAGPNPWRSMTLEWQGPSPPPLFNFHQIPPGVGGPDRKTGGGARPMPACRAPATRSSALRNPSPCRPNSGALVSHVLVIANETAVSSAL